MIVDDAYIVHRASEASFVDEQGLLELSARLPPGPLELDGSSFASLSQADRTPLRPSSSRASTSSASDVEDAEGAPSSTRREGRRPGRRVQQDQRKPKQKAKTDEPSAAHRLPLPHGATANVTTASGPASPVQGSPESSASSAAILDVHTFLRDLRLALALIITEVIFPLVSTLSTSLLGMISDKHVQAEENGNRPSQQWRKRPRRVARRAARDAPEAGQSFAEKFKFAICTSFLLTSSLSISFYDSEPEAQQPSPMLSPSRPGEEPISLLTQRRSSPARLGISVTGADACASSLMRASPSLLPRLNQTGRSIRDASLLAIAVLAVLSSGWDVWFRSCLVIVCLAWASILTMSLAELDDSLHFDVSHAPSPSAARSLLEARVDDGWTRYEQEVLQREALRKVRKLVKSAQAYDVAINKCIGAVQEVELVSRGYKLTHPLPPISRIEAAAITGGTTLGPLGSPPRNRHSILGLGSVAGARLSRSSSAGASAASNRKHAHRPLSWSLSNGRASPAFSSESHDGGELGRRSGGAGDASSLAHPRRLTPLRRVVLASLAQVTSKSMDLTRELAALVDKEELTLLKDMYALEGPVSATGSDSDLPGATDPEDEAGALVCEQTAEANASTWAASTPRNVGNKRQSLELATSASRGEDESWTRSLTSPVSRKRLSLLSDTVPASGLPYDRAAGASSSASKRDSLISEGLPSAYRSPRLHYVTDKSGTPGPNESAASKRLSYISASSVAGSIGSRSPLPGNLVGGSSPYRAGSPFGAYASPSSRGGEVRGSRMSIVGPNAIFGGGQPEEVVDPQTLLGLKHRFERTHLARRRLLCHLLALDFSMEEVEFESDARALSVEEYWERSCQLMADFTEVLDGETEAATTALRDEMGVDLGAALQSRNGRHRSEAEATTQSHLLSPSLEDRRGTPKARSGISGHLGLEDRFAAMAVGLRSIQAKLRVCAEDVGVRSPAELHGLGPDPTREAPVPSDANESDDAQAYADRIQQMFEGIKDDLLALSSEWEAGVKILKKERRSTPSPAMFDTVDEVARANAARDLESPMEADEDAAKVSDTDYLPDQGGGQFYEISHASASGDNRDDDDDDDDDIAALLLRSTSPRHLPPPGLEQVFESIAGIANIAGIGGSKLSREERIRQAKQKRERELEEKAKKASHRHTIDPAGIVSELNDVIRTRKAHREQAGAVDGQLGRQSLDGNRYRPSPPSPRQGRPDELDPGLGSPLELGGTASIAGVFESSATDDGGAWLPAAEITSQPTSVSSRRISRYNVANERRSPALYRHAPRPSDETSDSFLSHVAHHVRADQTDASFLSGSTSDSRTSLAASSPPRTLYEMDSPAAHAASRHGLTRDMRSSSMASLSGSSFASPSRGEETSPSRGRDGGGAGSNATRPASTTAAFALDLDLERHVAEFAARKKREAAAIGEDAMLEAE